MISQIHLGARVNGFNDEDLGTVKYLVADPSSDQITHFVVEHGDRDVVIEAGRIEGVGETGVQLNLAGQQMAELPDFVEREYVNTNISVTAGADVPLPVGYSLNPSAGGGMYYPVAGSQFAGGAPGNSLTAPIDPITDPIITGAGVGPVGAPYDEITNVPADSLIIKQGARVEALDGHVGSIKDVNLDPDTGRVVSFVVSKGFFFTHDVVVPVEMVAEGSLDAVTLNVNKDEVAR